MSNRVRLLGVVLAVALLAGCLGSSSPTATPTAAIEDGDPGPEQLRAATLSAMSDVSAYTAEQNATIVRQHADGDRTTEIAVEYAVNRTNRSLASLRTETAPDSNVTVDRYVVGETLYQRSDAFRAEYGSAWIQRDVSEGSARQFHLSDQLWRYRFVLDNATLSDVETATVDGTDAYVLTADVDTADLNTALREELDLPPGYGVAPNATLRATFWIDRETHRPIRVQRTANGTETIDDERVAFDRESTTRFTYENVSIALPDGADEATVVGEE